VADLHGLPVPATTVVGRRVASFSFGRPTGGGERWLRTCPAELVPGRFTTRRGWSDPFALLEAEDPAGTDLAAVLAQEGVRARWSGAAMPGAGGLLVEGVEGFGDDFMLARAAPPRSRPGSPTTSAASAPGPPPPSGRSASNGPTTATRPGSSSSTWPPWPSRPPPSPPAPRPAGTASTPPRALTASAT